MAKVESIFKIRGTIGDVTFRKTEDGIIAGAKPGPTREQVLTNDRFRLTRLNALEFKQANKDAVLLRRALGHALDGVRNTKLSGRMIGLLYAVASKDPVHDLGYRCAAAGDAGKLNGFDFNHNLLLTNALPIAFEHSLDVATGTVKVTIPSFIARKRTGFPKGATHFRIVSCGAVMNFMERRYSNGVKISELLPLHQKTPEVICLEDVVKAAAGDVVVQTMGVRFYKLEDGEEVLLKGGAMQVLEAVRIEDKLIDTGTQPHEAGLHSCARESSEALRQLTYAEASRCCGTGEEGNEGKAENQPANTIVSTDEESNKGDACFDNRSLILQEFLDREDAGAGFRIAKKREAYVYESG